MKNAEMWKQILHNGIYYPSEYGQELVSRILRSVVIDSKLFASNSNDHNYDWGKYVGICAPFPEMWIEFDSDIGRVGAYVAEKKSKDVAGRKYYHVVGVTKSNGLAVACVEFTVALDENGNLLGSNLPGCMYFGDINYFYLDDLNEEQKKAVRNAYCERILAVFLQLSCKNVSLSARDNDPKQVRIATKRHGNSATGYRYHVLVVRPPGSSSSHPGEEIGTMPLHVCRGHSVEYGPQFTWPDGTPKGKLFGKHEGRFFVPPHTRGNKKNGTVEKDYEVRAA